MGWSPTNLGDNRHVMFEFSFMILITGDGLSGRGRVISMVCIEYEYDRDYLNIWHELSR